MVFFFPSCLYCSDAEGWAALVEIPWTDEMGLETHSHTIAYRNEQAQSGKEAAKIDCI
jgi:hypothetical protein